MSASRTSTPRARVRSAQRLRNDGRARRRAGSMTCNIIDMP